MQELNSLEDVLKLCGNATAETLPEATSDAFHALVELGAIDRTELTRVFTALSELDKVGREAIIKATFPVINELGLSEVETSEVFFALKSATGANLTAIRKDFSIFLRLNDLVVEQESTATQLVKLALESGMEMWHDREGNPYATLRVSGHLEHHRLKTKAVKRYLAHLYYQAHEHAPNSQALQDALMTLEAKAVFEGPKYEPHTRLAEVDGCIYIDLANEGWQVLKASAEGWTVEEADAVPIRFRRPRGMLPLATPERGGSLTDLADLLNVERDSRDWRLIVAWLLQALRGVGPYPLLVLTGEQGSGKSTVAKMLRALLDPNVSPLRSLSRDERELFIAAVNGWALAFDNISGLSQWTSDALCKLSTGGGLSVRELHSDAEETLLDAVRPVVLNGITDFVDKQDLVSRALQVRLPSIPKANRKPEAAMWKQFDAVQPGILGALLDVVVEGLQRLPTTTLDTLPRLADFAVWATACESPLGWKHHDFMRAYDAAQADLIKDALEAEPVAVTLLKLPEQGDTLTTSWTFTASELLDELNKIEGYGKDGKRSPKGWPGAAHVLSGIINRIAPALLEQGVEVKQDRSTDKKRTKTWLIRLNGDYKRPKRPQASEGSESDVQDGENPADASSDASVSADASSVRQDKQASAKKTRAGHDTDASDASDASKPVSSKFSAEVDL